MCREQFTKGKSNAKWRRCFRMVKKWLGELNLSERKDDRRSLGAAAEKRSQRAGGTEGGARGSNNLIYF